MSDRLVKVEYCRNAGLGNKLFSWSRAKVFSTENSLQMIEPLWFSPRGAAITRGGIEYSKALRKIWLFGNFKTEAKNLPVWYNAIYSNKQYFHCADLNEAKLFLNQNVNSGLLFKWDRLHDFSDLLSYRNEIRTFLGEIIYDKSKSFIEQKCKCPFIGINVRTGKDFISSNAESKGYRQTAMNWFVDALRYLRANGNNEPAIIVSDGGNKQLDLLLKEPGTYLLDSSNAIEDLMVLSNAKTLLGSGNSSFSAWAAFLSGSNTYSSAETSFIHFKLPNTFDLVFEA